MKEVEEVEGAEVEEEVEGAGRGRGGGGEGAPKSAAVADDASCEAASSRAGPAAVGPAWRSIAPAMRTCIRQSRRRVASLSCASLTAAPQPDAPVSGV